MTETCGECIHWEHCHILMMRLTKESKCDFIHSKFKQKPKPMTAIDVCREVHQFCLKKGLENHTTDEQQLAYQQAYHISQALPCLILVVLVLPL